MTTSHPAPALPADEGRLVAVNGVQLCVRTYGDARDTPLLLIGNSQLTWPDELCERLAAGPRFVLRYDLRDTGYSTTVDPDAPAYTLRDLVTDAAALLAAHDLPSGHVVGFGVGGWIAQLLALDHPERVTTLTLIGTRPTAPGPNDADLPEHAPELMASLMNTPDPDWSDRAAVVAHMAQLQRHFAGSHGFAETAAAAHIGRVHDRTTAAAALTGADLDQAHRSNQLGTTFAALDSGPRWRERLPDLTAPTLVIHGEDDPFFPFGNAEALAREIPDAHLLPLPATGQELPTHAWPTLTTAILDHTKGS